MNRDRNKFGDVLERLLVAGKLTKAKLAADVSMAASTVSKMCNGQIRPQGMHDREKIIAIIKRLYEQRALKSVQEANDLIQAAGHEEGLTAEEKRSVGIREMTNTGNIFSINVQTPRLIAGSPETDESASEPQGESVIKDLAEVLATLTSDIYLDLNTGWLQRTRVRHVLLRVETVRLLISKVSGDALQEVGMEIGASAASDLMKNTLHIASGDVNMIPADYKFLIELWSYWESTGGLGRLSLLSQEPDEQDEKQQQKRRRKPDQKQDQAAALEQGKGDEQSGGRGSGQEQKPGVGNEEAKGRKWHIRLANNFLATKDPEERSRLNQFWCGYIKGFLNGAIPHMGNIIADPGSPFEVGTLYLVSEVSVAEDDANDPLFRVSFTKHPNDK